MPAQNTKDHHVYVRWRTWVKSESVAAHVIVLEHELEDSLMFIMCGGEYSLTLGSNYVGPAHGKQIADLLSEK